MNGVTKEVATRNTSGTTHSNKYEQKRDVTFTITPTVHIYNALPAVLELDLSRVHGFRASQDAAARGAILGRSDKGEVVTLKVNGL